TLQDILFDPQTSGGLMICVDREDAGNLLDELKSSGITEANVMGEIITAPTHRIVVG
ncbi:MAG: selenide, water dikinase SelD, partial [Deltaproteobacteria bacterium]|nr:selenide, water dikinase SelD [Deltaproteobacteria bacterium]